MHFDLIFVVQYDSQSFSDAFRRILDFFNSVVILASPDSRLVQFPEAAGHKGARKVRCGCEVRYSEVRG